MISAMTKLPFGNTGFTVTPLGFGAAPVGFLSTEQDQITLLLNRFLDAGCNVIDTAACYPGSEEAIGRAVAKRRDQFVLVSKCGHASGLATPDWDPRTIAASIDRSLQRLRTNHIDVMLLHSCGLDTLKRGDAIGAVVAAKKAGKVKCVGYSGDNDAAAWAAGHRDIEAIETSVNIADQANIDTVLPLCIERGKGVLAKRPIANACWKPLDAQPGMYQNYAGEYTRRFAAMGINATDLSFDKNAWPEIALRFTMAIEGVHCAIVGTTSPHSLEANLAAAAKGPLPPDAVKQLREAFAAARRASGGEGWLGQT